MAQFKNKVALVTGGGSGIGKALCQALARGGAIVVVSDVDEATCAMVAQEIRDAGGRAESVVLDVVDGDRFSEVVQAIEEEHGALDLLFNNAGIGVGGEAHNFKTEDWDRLVDVNIRGVLHGVVAAYPRMVARRAGAIVNIASLAGLVPTPGMAGYGMSKHAVVGLTTSMRAEANAYGVGMSVVCPGFIESNIYTSSKMVGWDRTTLMSHPALRKKMKASRCADVILKGVASNRPIITVTRHAFWGWRAYRAFPWVFWSWFGQRAYDSVRARSGRVDRGDAVTEE